MSRLTEGFRADDGKEAVRVVAGLLIGVGFLVLAFRRGTPDVFGDETSDFGLFLILAVPAAFLYGMGVLGRAIGGENRRWQSVFTVVGMLIMPLALFQFVNVVDESYDGSLVAIFVFGACAAGSAFAWFFAGVRFQLLLAAVYAAFAWIGFLDKAFSEGLESDLDAIRALLLAFAVGLVVAAVYVRRRTTVDPDAAFGELLTGAGVTALIAFSLAPIATLEGLTIGFGSTPSIGAGQDAIWDVLTLITGIGLVLFGVGTGLRAQVYVGTFMLLLFIASVGLDLDDPSPEGKIVGWPLLLLVVGAGLFLLSLAPREAVPQTDRLGDFFDGAADDPGHRASEAPTAQVAAPPPPPPPPQQPGT